MKKYLLTGLLIWIPIVITIWVLGLIVNTMDQTLLLLPEEWQPKMHIYGLGVLLTIVVVLTTGVLAELLIRIYYDRGEVAPYHTTQGPQLPTDSAWHQAR